jgi:hypothetical protein
MMIGEVLPEAYELSLNKPLMCEGTTWIRGRGSLNHGSI